MIGIVDLPDRLGAVRPQPEHGACSSCSGASRASAPAPCSRSRSRSSATCSRPQERGKYQGLFGAVFGIAFVAGPLIGGFLTENVGWHWIFYVNIPIGIVALIVIQRLLPTVKNAVARRATSTSSAALIFTVVDGVPAGRPDQQGLTIRRLAPMTATRRRLHPRRPRRDPAASSSPSRGPRSRSSRSTCGGAGPTRRRWSRRSSPPSRSSARSSSCRAGSRWSRASRPTNSGLAAAAAHGRPDRQLDRLRASSSRGPAATSGCSSARSRLMGFGDAADDPAHQGHRRADRLALDVHRRPRRRPDVLGVHDRRSRTRCRSSSSASRPRT